MSTASETVRRLSRKQFDAGVFLTVYLVLLYGIRSRLVIGPLGSAGAPALLAGQIGLGWWIFHQIQRADHTGFPRQPVRYALMAVACAFTASYAVAMLRPIDPLEVSTAQSGMLSLLSWLGVALLGCDGIPSRDRLEKILGRLVIGAGLLALLGIAQFVTNSPLVASWSFPGLTIGVNSPEIISRNGFTRPAGTAIHPIEYGAVLCMMLPLALTRARWAPKGLWWWRWGLVGVMALGIVVSISRSAMLCAGVGVFLTALVWSPRARAFLLAGMAVLVVVVSVVIPGMLGSLVGLFAGVGTDSSVSSRTGSYGIAGQFFSLSPWLGRGFATFLPSYRIFDNQYLLFLVEIGIIGLVSVITLVLTALWVARRARADRTDPYEREMGQALFASVAAAALGLAFYDGFSFPMATGLQFLIIGLCGCYYRLGRTGDPVEQA